MAPVAFMMNIDGKDQRSVGPDRDTLSRPVPSTRLIRLLVVVVLAITAALVVRNQIKVANNRRAGRLAELE